VLVQVLVVEELLLVLVVDNKIYKVHSFLCMFIQFFSSKRKSFYFKNGGCKFRNTSKIMSEISKEGNLDIQLKDRNGVVRWQHSLFILRKDLLEWTASSTTTPSSSAEQLPVELSPISKKRKESKAPAMETSFSIINAYIQSNTRLGPNVFIVRSDKGKDLILRSNDTQSKDSWIFCLKKSGAKEASFVQST